MFERKLLTEALDRAEEILRDSSAGWQNSDALSRLKATLERIEYYADGNLYVGEKVAGVEHYAEQLFSPRKHQKYVSSSESGVAVTYRRANDAIQSIRKWSDNLAEKEDENPNQK